MTTEQLKRKKIKPHRFTVSLEKEDYERLLALAEEQRPRLSVQYIAEYAICRLLDQADRLQIASQIGNPLRNREINGAS